MTDAQGRWLPDLAPKGYDVLNDYHRFLLLTGPRKSTKTTNVVNKICRHLWENNGATVAIVGKSLRNIKSSGVWQDLTVLESGMPQWFKAKIGFNYTVEPKLTADTKMTMFRVRNMYGGESECQVHSLEHDHEVEQKFKGTRFSMFYLPEADQFKSKSVIDILEDQLRIPTIPYENHQIILDCNPPEEAEDHFLYPMFFLKIGEDGEAYDPAFADMFRVIEFTLDDNPFISDVEKQTLISKYKHDKNKSDRFVRGKWVRDSSGGIFEDVFHENIHILGTASSPKQEDWEIILPGPNTFELFGGWDTGDVNHSWSLVAPRNVGNQNAFDLIDELVVIDRPVSLADFTEAVMERIEFWEGVMKELYGKEKIVRWRHWSDSDINKYRASADTYNANIVLQASKGKINLQAVNKGAGSVKRRIDLLRKLMFEARFRVSAQCRAHVAMCRFLKPSGNKVEVISAHSPYKHAFDSCTYILASEAPMDIERRNQATVGRRPAHIVTALR